MAAEPQNVSEEDKSRSVRMAAYAVAGVARFLADAFSLPLACANDDMIQGF